MSIRRSLYRLYRFIRVGAPRFLIVNELKLLARRTVGLVNPRSRRWRRRLFRKKKGSS